MSIKLKGSSDGSVSFDAPADTSPSGSDITLVLPTTVGSAEQFLKNSGTAGTLEFSSMVETSTGVGIGTTSPARPLSVSSSQISARFTSTSSDSQIEVIDSSGTVVYGSTSGNAIVQAGGSERLRIDSSGDVQARRARSNTAGDVALSVQPSDSTIHYGLRIDSTNNSLNLDRASGTATNLLTIDSSGKVGIGTSSPDYALHLNHSSSYLKISNSGTGEGGSDGLLVGIDGTGNCDIWNYENKFIRFATNNSERMRIDSSGNVGIGTATINRPLVVYGNSFSAISINTSSSGTADGDGVQLQLSGSNGYLWNYENGGMLFGTNGTERMRIDSSGRLLIGTTTEGLATFGEQLTIADTGDCGMTIRSGSSDFGSIYFSDATSGTGEYAGYFEYEHGSNFMRFGTGGAEQMRITSSGDVLIHTTSASIVDEGHEFRKSNFAAHTVAGGVALRVNRLNNDGDIVQFFQDSNNEGSISVSGTTISYNGGHLTRWSQLTGGAERTEILRGTVLSNLDEMCEWGEEDNEQLNRMQVSSVEGDVNVSGVFQAWDDDDDTYTNDFYCAMTGDFVIRIAQGTTVARGDLLMSAGDGTAKPQDDDIVRSKTIAKVTSTTVSTTYADGSYCVPCVLMAC